MNIIFCHQYYSKQQKNDLRKKADCIIVDELSVSKNNGEDAFLIDEEGFLDKDQPLRIVITSFEKINFDWVILNDRFKRNTMIVASDDDVLNNQDLVAALEQRGIALLMCASINQSELSQKSLMRSLESLRFKTLLIEGEISLMPSLNSLGQ